MFSYNILLDLTLNEYNLYLLKQSGTVSPGDIFLAGILKYRM